MENRSHALAAGLFILLLGLVIVGAVVWMGGDHTKRDLHVIVGRTSVSGLSTKASVKLRGVEVGTVESVGFDPQDARRILIRISVDAAAPLTLGTYAQLGYQGVTGLAFIDLSDKGDDPRPRPHERSADPAIELRPSLLDQLATSGPELLSGLNESAKRLNAVLSEPNQQRFARLLDASGRAADQLADRSSELQPVLSRLPTLVQHLDQTALTSESALRTASNTAMAATRLADDLRGRLGVLDGVSGAASSVGSSVHSIELSLVGPHPSATPLFEDVGQAARSIDRFAGQLGEKPQSIIFGKGVPQPGPGEAGFDASGRSLR